MIYPHAMPGTIPSRLGPYSGRVKNVSLDDVDHVDRAVLPIGTDNGGMDEEHYWQAHPPRPVVGQGEGGPES